MNKIVLLLCLTSTSLIAQSFFYNTNNSVKFSGNVVKVEVSNKSKSEAQIQADTKPSINKKTKIVAIKFFSTKYVIDYIRTINKTEQVQCYKGKIEIAKTI